jgi:hypothetical protein
MAAGCVMERNGREEDPEEGYERMSTTQNVWTAARCGDGGRNGDGPEARAWSGGLSRDVTNFLCFVLPRRSGQ